MTWEVAKPRVQQWIRFWQAQLDLQDLYIELQYNPLMDASTFAEVTRASAGADGHLAKIIIGPALLELSMEEVATTILHELVHVLLWPLSYATYNVDSQFTTAQLQLVSDLLARADEEATYRLERILTKHVRLPKELLTDLEDDATVSPKRKKRLRRRSIHKQEKGIGFHADADD